VFFCFFIDCFIEDQNIVYTFGSITIIKCVNYLGILYFSGIFQRLQLIFVIIGCIEPAMVNDFNFYKKKHFNYCSLCILEIHIFWAQHQVHHSSEEFNVTVGIRQSVFQSLVGIVSEKY